MKQAYPEVPIVIGEHEAIMLIDAWVNLSAVFGTPIVSPPADRTLAEGETIDYAGIALEVRHIPGHSPGHIVFVHHGKPTHVFGGDVLFRGSIGRFDFPGGSESQLLTGIREKLFNLPGDTIVYPGHGPVTTIAHEKRTNPYVAE
jgi:glyoxylase-like metal-dependent hydrolase (beta-lactamase superfamily II)